MKNFPPSIANFVKELSSLPGIGNKSATRLTFFLLSRNKQENIKFLNALKNLIENARICSLCGNVSESDPCHICTDENRNKKLLCIVENAYDVYPIELSGSYNGLYHILGGVIDPINGMTPEKLNLQNLKERIIKNEVEEVIIAINPDIEGETTALYIKNMLKDLNVKITRLAFGIPVGGSLEFVDNLTISRALTYRQNL